MLLGFIEIIIHPCTVKGHVKAAYLAKGHEAAYAKYRELTGCGIRESHLKCRKWLICWGFKGEVTKRWGGMNK